MGARRWVQAEEGSRTSRLALSLAEGGNKKKSLTQKADDCGTGAGGFKPGNDCAEGHGRPPSDRRQGPVTEKESRDFADFFKGLKELKRENRSDSSKIEEDPDGNKFDETEEESGASIGFFDSRSDGVAAVKELEAHVSDELKNDLVAWTRNSETVVKFFRKGESRLDEAAVKVKEAEGVLQTLWDEEVLQNIEEMPEDQAKEAVVRLAEQVRYASNRAENSLRDSHNVQMNQLPSIDGGDPFSSEDHFRDINSLKPYEAQSYSLVRMREHPEEFSSKEYLEKFRLMRDTYEETHAGLKSTFKKVHEYERAYISRLENQLKQNIRPDGKPVTLYRGIRIDGPGPKRIYDDIVNGDDFFELNSVNSTSMSSRTAADFANITNSSRGPAVFFKITARKGAAIGSVSAYKDESEVLLPPRSNARITSKNLVWNAENEKPVLYVEMEMIDE